MFDTKKSFMTMKERGTSDECEMDCHFKLPMQV